MPVSQLPRILVVEDELMIVLMLESLLTEAGFEVADPELTVPQHHKRAGYSALPE